MKRKELKTLKEIKFFSGDNIDEVLKAEAVKWVKSFPSNTKSSYDFYSYLNIREWIKHFFNITEEDLKKSNKFPF